MDETVEVYNTKVKVTIFGEDSLLARGISDSLEKDYSLLNSYSNLYNLPRTLMFSHAWIPEIDATNEEFVEELVSQSDIVINCCGLVNTDKCKDNIYEAYKANILTADIVSKYCLKYEVYLVHLATTASYGSNKITEETTPSIFQTIYSGTKLIGEKIVCRRFGENCLIIRPCFVFGGLRDNSSVLKKLIQRFFRGDDSSWEVTLALENKKDYIWIEDFSQAVKSLIDNKLLGVYNISNGSPKTYSHILDILKSKNIEVNNIVWRGDLDYLGNHLVSNSKLMNNTDWKPQISLEKGIDYIINEYI